MGEIFEDRQKMMIVWRRLHERTNSQIEIFWGNVKFFFLVISGLLATSTVILGIEVEALQFPWKTVALIIIPVFLIYMSRSGLNSAERSYRRFLEFAAYLGKVEEIIGLSEPKRTRIFQDDEYVFDRYVKRRQLKKYSSSKKFIEGEIKKPDSVYRDVKRVYRAFVYIGCAFIILALIDVVLRFTSLCLA